MKTVAGIFLLTLALGAHAQQYEAGVHYQPLPVPVQTANNDAVEVVEVFSYACVHCYNFEAPLATWVARHGSGVDFRRSPAIFNPTWEQLARAYYAAEALGVTVQMHAALFEAIHVVPRDVRDPEVLAELFYEQADVDPVQFNKVFASFGVRSKVQQASARGRAYRVTSVPSFIVNGKYRIDARMAGGSANMLKVAEFLIERERAGDGPAELAAGS
jgi:thiol:disulfide interchange protein DsbA